MRISQCAVSKSVHDFPFERLYGLTSYVDSAAPCVFFGCYDRDDVSKITHHKGLAVIWWCGQDALDFKGWSTFGTNVVHVTERVKVYEHIKSLGIQCRLLPCTNLSEPGPITPLGNKVFAYAPGSYPEYHGIEIINQLRDSLPYEFVIGDGSIPQPEWRAGKCEPIYKECFVGLVLSHFAGGGASVIELGLRGRKCVTNVVKLGNVINWTNIDDIMIAIHDQAKFIGQPRAIVACDTILSIDYSNKFLNINEYTR